MKNNSFTLSLAKLSELSDCIAILADGRRYQRSQGFTQWPSGYPAEGDVTQDILARRGYVLKDKDKICALPMINY